LAEIVLKVLDEFGIAEKLYCITSDNAGNNLTMAKELDRLLGERGIEWDHEKHHIPCLSHVINIAVQKFLKAIKSDCLDPNGNTGQGIKFSDVIANIRTIAKSIKTPQNSVKFQKICESYSMKSLTILLDCPTCWNSTHRMLERTIFLRKAIHRYVEDDEKLHDFKLSDKQWELMELLCAFLWPFKNCTDCLQGTLKPEVDRVFWAYNRMFDEIDDFKDTLVRREVRGKPWVKELEKALGEMETSLRKYYSKTAKPGVYVDSMILHPRTKLAKFKGKEWSVGDDLVYRRQCKERYEEGYTKLDCSSDFPSPTSRKRKADEMEDEDEYDKYIGEDFDPVAVDEFEQYITSPRVQIKSALEWWKANQHQYPHLARMA